MSIGLWMRKLFCSWCTKVSSGPLLHIQSWKIAAQQKNSFQKCTNFTGSHCSLKTNILSGIYLTFVMAMTTVSVIMTVMVLNFFYRGPVLTEVPPWVRKWVGYQTIILSSTFLGFVKVNFWQNLTWINVREGCQKMSPIFWSFAKLGGRGSKKPTCFLDNVFFSETIQNQYRIPKTCFTLELEWFLHIYSY